MKRTLIITQCCICFLLAATNIHAQSAPQAKAVPDDNALKAANKPTINNSKDKNNKPVLPPQNSTTEKATPVSTSPLTGEQSNNLPKGVKLKVVSADDRSVAAPNSEENRKTMNGTAQAPKEQLKASVFTDQDAKPLVVPKPAPVTAPATAKPATNTETKIQKPGNR